MFCLSANSHSRIRLDSYYGQSGTDCPGQPSLDYGEFTGTLLVYEVKAGATNLGWGTYSTGYSWLADSTNGANSLGSGSYLSGVSLDSSKTYAFIGNWCQGC